ncbi:MAG: DUF1285 domain-containing protein [Geminicoccaceae bacterium]
MSDQPPRTPEGSGVGHGIGADAVPGERLYHMRIDWNGVWHHEGRPILRKPLVKLLASILRREADGSYWLVTPVERGRIEVEDAPFLIVELAVDGEGRDQIIRAKSSLDEWVTVGPDHPLRLRLPKTGPASGPLPYVVIRPNLEGRLSRSVYYQLVELGDSHPQDGVPRYGVWSAGRFFVLE